MEGDIPKPMDEISSEFATAVVFAPELGSAILITMLDAVGGAVFDVNPGTSPRAPMLPMPGIARSKSSKPVPSPSNPDILGC